MKITATLNTASVEAKLRAWAMSSAGKQKMDAKIAEYVEGDVRETQAGSRVITVGFVDELANELAGMIKGGAAQLSFSVSGSGATHIGGGAITATLTIGGNLSRPSIYPEGGYEGARNIVLLFEKGWSAGGKLWGFWNGDYTWTRMTYPGDHFISEAVNNFNAMYSGLGITAAVTGVYA